MAVSLVTAAAAAATGDHRRTGPDGSSGAGANAMPQQPNLTDLQKRLESPSDTVKRQALKEVVLWATQHPSGGSTEAAGIIGGGFNISSGTMGHNVATRLLMTVIRFVLPSTDHQLKRLLQLYWEVVDKTKPDGSLKEEMILVCNKLREDLLHPNEYIRGTTLRLLCKIKYRKIVEPLVEAIVQNLSHVHAFVRRNAVMCVYALVRTFGIDFIPHSTEEVQRLLLMETDISTKRNAFVMLINCDLNRAILYALSVQDKVACLGDIFQLALLELLRRVSRETPAQTGNLLRIIVTLLDSCCSGAVAYEGGSVLLALTSSPVALKAATRAYMGLLAHESDNNVKLIVLDRLHDIFDRHSRALEEYVVDILRALASPSLAVRKKALGLGLKLVNNRTVTNVVTVLRKELVKTLATDGQQQEQGELATQTAYQQMLLQSIRAASKGHLNEIRPLLNLLLDFLADRNSVLAFDVANFIRELIAVYPELRLSLLPRIADAVANFQHARVTRLCLWILGEYTDDTTQRRNVVETLFQALSPFPFTDVDVKAVTGNESNSQTAELASGTFESSRGTQEERADLAVSGARMKVTTCTVILPDGTYGTEDLYEPVEESQTVTDKNPVSQSKRAHCVTKLRSLVTGGDFLMASIIAMAAAKLAVRPVEVLDLTPALSEEDHAKCLLMVSSLWKYCSEHPCCGPKSDATIRVNQALRLLIALKKHAGGCNSGNPAQTLVTASNLAALWFPGSRDSLRERLDIEDDFAPVVYSPRHRPLITSSTRASRDASSFFVSFRQFGNDDEFLAATGVVLDDMEADIALARGCNTNKDITPLFQQRLAKVQQMTGLADPVYVEALLHVNQFDFIVELLIINRTNETLQNVSIELSTHGDLRIVDRPPVVTLSAGESHTLQASIRVQSTETGIIFGYIAFDKASSIDKEYLVLNELHVDLLDFIERSCIGELAFRSMWAEFEWENKITISTPVTDVSKFVEHIIRQTNMTIVGKYVSAPSIATLLEQPSGHLGSLAAHGLSNGSSVPHNTPLAKQQQQFGEDHHGIQGYIDSLKKMPVLQRLMNQSSFFAVNLYSKSIFGEDALANVSIEKLPNGRLAGNVRIRSRSQGIALSLGDRVTVLQRGIPRD